MDLLGRHPTYACRARRTFFICAETLKETHQPKVRTHVPKGFIIPVGIGISKTFGGRMHRFPTRGEMLIRPSIKDEE